MDALLMISLCSRKASACPAGEASPKRHAWKPLIFPGNGTCQQPPGSVRAVQVFQALAFSSVQTGDCAPIKGRENAELVEWTRREAQRASHCWPASEVWPSLP